MIYDVCVIYDMLTSSFPSQPIFGIDVHGNVNEWNNKTAEITGFSKEEAHAKPLVSTFIVPSLRKSVHDVMENALKGIETSNYELEFETKSGEIRYLLVNATTRRDPENLVVGGKLCWSWFQWMPQYLVSHTHLSLQSQSLALLKMSRTIDDMPMSCVLCSTCRLLKKPRSKPREI
jgi:PAS domain S-box-containing protein